MDATLAEVCGTLEKHGLKPALRGDAQRRIRGIATLEDAGGDELSFVSNPKYIRALQTTRASAVVLRNSIECPDGLARIDVDDPYAAITALIVEYYGYRRHATPPSAAGNGHSLDSRVHPTATVGPGARIYPGATVDEHVTVGRNVVLYPGVYVGPRCRLGDDVILYPNVVVYDDTVIGHRVTIHAGTVIGEDGLGYAPVGGRWVKIPQIGAVEIGDDVEIGANCAIDRATLGRTRIGAGTKFSNLIAIGHGTQIGEHCMLVAQVGLAGSVQVGSHVTMAGQVGVVGHVQIGDRATIGAKAGVTNSVPEGETYLGAPAIPIRDMKRQVALLMRLPEMHETIRGLERQIQQLQAQLGETRPQSPGGGQPHSATA